MAREGIYFFLPFLLIAIFLFYLFSRIPNINFIFAGAAVYTIGCLLLLFFRDPARKIPQGERLIVSPADGRIVDISQDNDRILISIFLSIFNVHINRVPVSGTVKRLAYRPGKFLSAFRKSASRLNERFEIEINTGGHSVTIHQIAGVLARRVVCRLKKNQNVSLGEKFGMIRFGSRIDLFLPASAEILVQKRQRVRGGSTIIGRLP